MDWPGQTILCVSKIYWTAHITNKLPEGPESLSDYTETCTHELNEIVKLVRGRLSTQNRTTLGLQFTEELTIKTDLQLYRPKIIFLFSTFTEALITLDVHGRDVLTQLCEQGVNQASDFKWLCQMRYYWIVSSLKYGIDFYSL